MENEYILYVPESLNDADFLQALSKSSISYQLYNSAMHHPNALLLHRTGFSKKVISPDFESNWSKVSILYFPSLTNPDLLEELSDVISTYNQNNIRLLLLFQGIEDYIASLGFIQRHTQAIALTDQTFEETFEYCLTKFLLQGTDAFVSESYRQSADIILRILAVLTKSPYKIPASIYRTSSKKLQANTEIPLKSREFALQLINVPGISEVKALKIIEEFPTLYKLMEFYSDSGVGRREKENRFTNLFERKEKRVSQKIYTVYNSLNPDEIV